MRTLLQKKLMSSVGAGGKTAAEEGARNMSQRCQSQGAVGSFVPKHVQRDFRRVAPITSNFEQIAVFVFSVQTCIDKDVA